MKPMKQLRCTTACSRKERRKKEETKKETITSATNITTTEGQNISSTNPLCANLKTHSVHTIIFLGGDESESKERKVLEPMEEEEDFVKDALPRLSYVLSEEIVIYQRI